MNKVMLRLVSGEDVYYGLCGELMKADTILMEIKDNPFIEVEDKKGMVLTIFPDKVIGCYTKENTIF